MKPGSTWRDPRYADCERGLDVVGGRSGRRRSPGRGTRRARRAERSLSGSRPGVLARPSCWSTGSRTDRRSHSLESHDHGEARACPGSLHPRARWVRIAGLGERPRRSPGAPAAPRARSTSASEARRGSRDETERGDGKRRDPPHRGRGHLLRHHFEVEGFFPDPEVEVQQHGDQRRERSREDRGQESADREERPSGRADLRERDGAGDRRGRPRRRRHDRREDVGPHDLPEVPLREPPRAAERRGTLLPLDHEHGRPEEEPHEHDDARDDEQHETRGAAARIERIEIHRIEWMRETAKRNVVPTRTGWPR